MSKRKSRSKSEGSTRIRVLLSCCLVVLLSCAASAGFSFWPSIISSASGSKTTLTVPVSASGPQSLTNVEKLSLPLATALGTQVSVSDGFYVSGFGDSRDGLWIPNGISNGDVRYVPALLTFVDEGVSDFCYHVSPATSGDVWRFNHNGESAATGDNGSANPWGDTYDGLTLTHPALQQLAAASTAQGGVFVSGGTQDGVYSTNGTFGGKDAFIIVGNSDPDKPAAVIWTDSIRWIVQEIETATALYYSLSDVATPDLAGTDKVVMAYDGVAYSRNGTTLNGKPVFNKIGSSGNNHNNAISSDGSAWNVWDDTDTIIDSSSDNPATPDLATFGTLPVTNVAWLNASDDTPAPALSVTSVTQGQLGAGLRIGDVTYRVNGNLNGRNVYSDVLGVGNDVTWNGSGKWIGEGGSPINLGNVAFPFLGAPEVTVDRDDVANEANWIPYP